jgi:hypothetical protein
MPLPRLFKIGDDYEALALVLRTKEQEIYDLKMRFKSDGDLYEKVPGHIHRTSFFRNKSTV